MITDRYSGCHTSSSHDAIAGFEDAVLDVVAHRPDAAAALDRALAADPGLVAAHALKGFAAVILARAELDAPAVASLREAEAALLGQGYGTAMERGLVAALGEAVAGRLSAAASMLEAHLLDHPRDLLALKLSHTLRFMLGESGAMLETTGRALGGWTSAMPGYGFVLGCHAFALEECGDRVTAQRAGHAALRNEPRDAWGLHAVAHVYEMEGRAADGIAWLDHCRPTWTACNNFRFHVAWHLALFLHGRGDTDRALALYDAEVRPQPTDDWRDVANAVSLLWRLGQENVDVGDRWAELRSIAHRRRQDTTLIFASLHYLMALVATGATASAQDLVAAIRERAVTGTGDQAGAAATIGYPIAQVILEFATGRDSMRDMVGLGSTLTQLGGSHAQRDVFMRTLALIAANRDDRTTAERVLALRRRLKRDDRFVSLVARRLRSAGERPRHGAGARVSEGNAA